MLTMASWATKDPDEKQRMVQGVDAVNKENIIPLVNTVKVLQTAFPVNVNSEQVTTG